MAVHYNGIYDAAGCVVFRTADQGGRKLLSLRREIRNYAPAFSWGANTRGAAQLALALLCDALGRGEAETHYQAFLLHVVQALPALEDWQLTREDIAGWLATVQAPAAGVAAAYSDPSCPERACDYCGKPYRGPAVYCSLECATADAE
jgi:Family of unknown function (DUF6166)